MTLKIFTDGASKGNPGPAGIGIIGFVDGKELFRHKEAIGVATNNVAEYSAIIKALELVKRNVSSFGFQVSRIEFNSDSKLVVEQLNDRYKVKNAAIREFILKIHILEAELKLPISYTHIPREKNHLADALVNEVFLLTL